jgi:DNA modification methylase
MTTLDHTLPRVALELADLPHVPITDLAPFQGELKELTEREYNKLKKSILENGLIVPFFVWQEAKKLLDGHQRRLVFIKEGWLMSVPVVYISAASEQDAKKKLLVISSQYGKVTQEGWDTFTFDLPDDWIQETVHFDALPFVFDYDEVGNGAGESQDAEPQTNRSEELQEIWQVQPGDLWRLPSRTAGQCHYLICGDCTDRAVVERVMGGERAELVVTDPPYGVEYADKNKFLNAISPANRIQTPIENDHQSKEETQAMWKAAFCEMSAVMLPGAVVYCFMPQGGDQMMMMMMMMMMGAGIEPRHELIWLKNNHVLGRVDYAYKHEPILYAWKAGGHKFYGDFQTSILEFPKPQRSDMHPTTKPTALLERLVSNSSRVGSVVYDPFVGSGTTIIAAENLGRQCRAIEISEAYTAVCLQRYRDAFKIEPELIGRTP